MTEKETPIYKDPELVCGLVESLIFMSDRPLSLEKIRTAIDEQMPLEVLGEAIDKLQKEYEGRHHGLGLMEIAGGFQFRTKEKYAHYIRNFFKVNSIVLSPTAMEVLVIIAYRQPISKSDIDKARGVDSAYVISGLIDKHLIKMTGRSDKVGRSMLYSTTPKFLELFSLSDISELPPEHELDKIRPQKAGSISDLRTFAGSKDSFYFDELKELDLLGEEIKKIGVDTDFTKDLKKMTKNDSSKEPPKSAFDILTEHIDRKQISIINARSAESEMEPLQDLLDKTALNTNILKGSSLDLKENACLLEEEDIEKKEEILDKVTQKIIDSSSHSGLNLESISDPSEGKSKS